MLDYIKKKIEQEKKELDEWSKEREAFFEIPDDIEMKQNISYDLRLNDPRNRFDIFKLKNQEFKLPVIINIHGGGLLMGNKEQNKGFNIWLAQQGFLVYSVEYSLVPNVKTQKQIKEINLAMMHIKNRIENDGGDIDNVCVVGDSAGAFLGLYATAMQNSGNIAMAFRTISAKLKIKAIGLQSGMFYTTKFDEIGLFLSNDLYGKGYKKYWFAEYLNPEHDEVLNSLPPVYLMTSKNDNLKRYTLKFAKALKKHGIKHELVCYPKNDNMPHAFSALYPEREESIKANEEMINFLKEMIGEVNE